MGDKNAMCFKAPGSLLWRNSLQIFSLIEVGFSCTRVRLQPRTGLLLSESYIFPIQLRRTSEWLRSVSSISRGHTTCFVCTVMLTCDHCCRRFGDAPFRVKSEESGVVLLDMIVCYDCYAAARELEQLGGHISTSTASYSGKESQLR